MDEHDGNDSNSDSVRAGDLEPPVRVRHLPALKPLHDPDPPVPDRLPAPDSIQAQLAGLIAAQGITFQRIDAQGKLLETVVQNLLALVQELTDSIKINQEQFLTFDERMDRVARITAALIKMFQLAQQTEPENEQEMEG